MGVALLFDNSEQRSSRLQPSCWPFS